MHALTRTKIGSNVYTASIPGGTLFYSYETPVAAVINGACYRTEQKWSMTTTQQINKWLNGVKGISKPQAWFDAWGRGEDPTAAPIDTTKEAQVFVGGITLLIQQPINEQHSVARMVEDEDGFIEALHAGVPGFKCIDSQPIYFNGRYQGEAPSITLINGIIPVVVEVSDDVDLDAFVELKSQEILKVWNRFAK